MKIKMEHSKYSIEFNEDKPGGVERKGEKMSSKEAYLFMINCKSKRKWKKFINKYFKKINKKSETKVL